jgi:hypothetical protein
MFLHRLQSIATLMQTLLMVTLTQYVYDMVYFLCQLGAFRMQRCKEHMWKVCEFRYGSRLQESLGKRGFKYPFLPTAVFDSMCLDGNIGGFYTKISTFSRV